MSTVAIPGAPDDVVRVFVSYAREDRRWLDPDYRFSLIPFLKESLRRHKAIFWFDKELKPGDEFGRLILSQIELGIEPLLNQAFQRLTADLPDALRRKPATPRSLRPP